MSGDVFISYKREDETRVAPLVQALERQGLSVWWDRALPGGENWRGQIESALAAARCVVVVWSAGSVGPQGNFVRDEAARAMRRHILVPVLIDKVAPPLGFGELQAVDLTHWRGSPRDAFLQDLVEAIRAKLAGRAVPPPKGPMKRVLRRLSVGSLLSALTVAAGLFATNALHSQNALCSLPLLQPGLSDTCGLLALGERPQRDERLAWEKRTPGDCQALRDHLRTFKSGAFSSQANALINARSVERITRWQAGLRQLDLYVDSNRPPAPDEATAQAQALARGQQDAERQCRAFAQTSLFRFRAARPQVQQWQCDRSGGGRLVCSFQGSALCELDESTEVEIEHCDAAAPASHQGS